MAGILVLSMASRAKRRVIAFDNRGVGASGNVEPYTIERWDDAIAFIRAMGLSQVDLLGFSLGGGVAQMGFCRRRIWCAGLCLREPGRGRWRYRRDQQDCRHPPTLKAALTLNVRTSFFPAHRMASARQSTSLA